jgi:hypothetical protein
MAFGKPPVPKTLADNPHVGPDTYEANKLTAQMVGGVQLRCGCVAVDTRGGRILRNCFKHKGLERLLPRRLLKSRFPGICVSCNKAIEVDAPVYWEKGIGAWHEECPEPVNAAGNRG